MRISTICLILFSSQFLFSQEPGEIVFGIGKINSKISENQDDFSGIKEFILNELSKASIAYSESKDPNFYLQTDINYAYEKDLDMNGVALKVAELQFNFKLASRYGNLQFGNYTTFLKESGENRRVLLRNAARILRKKSAEFETFIKEAQVKIFEYYSKNCNEVLSAGEQFIKLEQFDDCIVKMGQVPKEVECAKHANELMVTAYHAKLTRSCDILNAQIRTLIQKESFSEAFELLSVLPQNSTCKDKLEVLIDELDHAVCEKYILSAEAHFAKGNFSKCVDVLSSIEKISKNCQTRKHALETKMRARLDASAKQQWDFKIKKYNDQLVKDREQSRTNHEFVMKKLDIDASVRSKELDVSVEMEKYKTQREIEFSKNNAAVEKVRIREIGKIYKSYFNMVGNVLMDTHK